MMVPDPGNAGKARPLLNRASVAPAAARILNMWRAFFVARMPIGVPAWLSDHAPAHVEQVLSYSGPARSAALWLSVERIVALGR